MTYALDFDGTLDDVMLHRAIIKLNRERNDIWVVTARKDNEYNRAVMKPILDKLFISMSSVVFCNEKSKVEYLQGINADIYIDNITDEFEEIKNHTNIVPLLWQ